MPEGARSATPLATARGLPLEKRDQDALRGEEARTGGRRWGCPRASGPRPRLAGDRHEPAHALRDLVETGTVGKRAILTEARDGGIDQAGVWSG